MANDDLLELAKSTDDYYALLDGNVHSGSTDKEIQSAYRKAALKSHPDKHKGDPGAVERFHKLQIAYNVLSDPAAKAAYDTARLAREAKARQYAMLEGKRKAMYDDLVKGENEALKRKRDGAGDATVEEMEMRRMAASNRQRRLDMEEARRKAREEAVLQEQQPVQTPTQDASSGTDSRDRTIKVSWPREGHGLTVDQDALQSLFSDFGTIETIMVRPDKKIRLQDDGKKRLCGTAVIEYQSIVGAHAAVTHDRRDGGSGGFWALAPKIEWITGKIPESLEANPPKPSFGASFKRDTGTMATGPTLEEITLIRLRNAERKKLEDQIRAQEAEEG